MKLHKLLLVALLAVCVSCKKDKEASNPSLSPKKYELVFDINSFEQGVGDLEKGTLKQNGLAVHGAGLKDSIDIIYYFLFRKNGVTDHHTQYLSTSANFGIIKDSVSVPGEYQVVIAAGKNGFSSVDGPNMLWTGTFETLKFTYLNSSENGVVNVTPWKDAFYKTFTITVPAVSTVIPVKLERIVSQVEVNITDATPANAARMELVIENDQVKYPWYTTAPTSLAALPYSTLTTKSIDPSDRGKPNFKITAYTTNYYLPFSVLIKCYDIDGKLITSKQVINVTCQRNKKTTLTGKLFTSTVAGGGFHAEVDTEWAAPATVAF